MTTDQLLGEMAALIWDNQKGLWFARARECNTFEKAPTTKEAMIRAIDRRAGLLDAPPMPNEDLF